MERFPFKRPGLDGSPSNVPAAQSLLHCTIESWDGGNQDPPRSEDWKPRLWEENPETADA